MTILKVMFVLSVILFFLGLAFAFFMLALELLKDILDADMKERLRRKKGGEGNG